MPSIGGKIIPRGKGWYNTGATVDDKYYDSTQSDYVGCPSEKLEGQVVTYKPRTKSTRISQDSGGDVTMIMVRNVGAAALLPGRLVSWQTAQRGKRVDGYVTTLNAEVAGVVDDFWPAAGVPVGELFWLVVRGRTTVLTDLAAAESCSIAEFGVMVALTAATSGATTAGRVSKQSITGTSDGTDWTTYFNAIQNRIGRAMSANTTNQTNRSLLADIDLL